MSIFQRRKFYFALGNHMFRKVKLDHGEIKRGDMEKKQAKWLQVQDGVYSPNHKVNLSKWYQNVLDEAIGTSYCNLWYFQKNLEKHSSLG